MARFLICITCGAENASKAALALNVAKAALDEKHEVTVFLACEAAHLLRPAAVESLSKLGAGSLKPYIDAVLERGGKIFVSDIFANGRGFDPNAIEIIDADYSTPMLVRLAVKADKVMCY